jgi:tagatose-1,6-bisphosphate aldolase non-catalytic subunit AgaZ/GatZ
MRKQSAAALSGLLFSTVLVALILSVSRLSFTFPVAPTQSAHYGNPDKGFQLMGESVPVAVGQHHAINSIVVTGSLRPARTLQWHRAAWSRRVPPL